MNTSQISILVTLPTYNEAENILPLIDDLLNLRPDIGVVVIDDDSPDGTAASVREAFGADDHVCLYVRAKERGLATAIAYGIRRAQGDAVAVMDTDFNHDPALLPQMVKFLEYYDIIIGSRFTMGGGMEERWRYLASFLFNFFVRLILRTQVQDNLCGFFTMRRDKLLRMDIERIFHGYGEYFMHLLFLAWREDYTILEVPAFYRVRMHGESKSRFFHMLYSYTLTALKVRLGKR